MTAWQLDTGEITFVERGAIRRGLTLPCGQCVGCRLERSRRWAMRCLHEAQLHDFSSFVTLTYNDENVPTSLRYRDFQLFMKRLRKRFGPVRFYMCGEYGEQNFRPHFHACLFGIHFGDRVLLKESQGSGRLYRSDALDAVWSLGYASIGDVTFESAAYVARYVMKKVTGHRAEEHYQRVCLSTGELVQVAPEFNRMSLRPGIGAGWIEKYCSDVFGFDRDWVRVNGVKCKPPRYYYDYLERKHPDVYESIEYKHYVDSDKCIEDSTAERLAVRERVTLAKLKHKKRSI
ncbi:MAG: replication initiator protein [Microvirus sp.]|nr:MAG: replication initiator protein [Microvirus sp.]